MGHLGLLCTLLERYGVQPRVIGFGDGTPVIRGTEIVTKGSTISALSRAALSFAMLAITARYDAMVLTSAGAPFNPLLAVIARARGKALLYDCHDPPIEATSRIFAASRFVGILRRYLEVGSRIIDRCASLTLSVSPGLDDLLRKHGSRGRIARFYNLHNAIESDVDTQLVRLRSDRGWEDACILIYVGGLQAQIRGLEEQIAAVRIVREKGHNVRLLVLYGSGDADFVRREAGDLLQADVLRLVYNVPPKTVRAYLREADLAVNKTLSYALPSKIFEYVAAGITILSSDRDDDVTLLFRNFVIRHDDDPESLAAAILSFRNTTVDRFATGMTFVTELYGENCAAVEKFAASL